MSILLILIIYYICTAIIAFNYIVMFKDSTRCELYIWSIFGFIIVPILICCVIGVQLYKINQ